MMKKWTDGEGDDLRVEVMAGATSGVYIETDNSGWLGSKRQALEVAAEIKALAEALPDPDPDPWGLLRRIVNTTQMTGNLTREVRHAIAWHREKEKEKSEG